jgi:hypothetical protein
MATGFELVTPEKAGRDDRARQLDARGAPRAQAPPRVSPTMQRRANHGKVARCPHGLLPCFQRAEVDALRGVGSLERGGFEFLIHAAIPFDLVRDLARAWSPLNCCRNRRRQRE